MRRVISKPATVVIESDEVPTYIVCLEAALSDEWEYPTTIEMHGSEDIRFLDISDIELDLPGMLVASTVPNGYRVTVRSVEPDDAEAVPGLPDFPVPVALIGAILTGETLDAHLEALVQDDGYVATVLLVSDTGMWVRYSAAWIPLASIDLIDGLEAVEIPDRSLDLYDAADQANQQIVVSALTGAPAAMAQSEVYVASSADKTFKLEETITAAGMALIPVKIDTVDDLPAAIQAAADDPSIRWYVERRARHLDPDVELPWRTDG